MSSQRTRSCQGPLQSHALLVLTKALREQFELGLGAHLLSGVRRWCTARPIASRRGETVASCDSHITVLDPSARVGAGPRGGPSLPSLLPIGRGPRHFANCRLRAKSEGPLGSR